jgi:alkylation response protein AidB-like acyl-CoA dehydrogenase
MHTPLIPHPSSFIDAAIAATIIEHAAAAEQLQQLHPQQVAIIHEQKWLKLFVPTKFGGLQLSLPEGLQKEEGIAWADGSTAWTVTLCSGANWFIGFLQTALAEALFLDQRVCLAGSGRATGVAKDVGNAYEVTGHWKYATGAFMATAFTANCVIEKEGKAMQNEDGSPLIKSFVFLRKEVSLHPTWKAIGMIATASNSFAVQQITIPKNRSFVISANTATIDLPIYNYPFQQFAEATLAVNSSGMAMRFFDLCKPTEDGSNTTSLSLNKWTTAYSLLQTARNDFYNAIDQSWKAHMLQQPAQADALKAVTVASRTLAAIARKSVDAAYPYCGLSAANPATEMNRVWRNLHTASQHTVLLDL